jgi:hypothetical protein
VGREGWNGVGTPGPAFNRTESRFGIIGCGRLYADNPPRAFVDVVSSGLVHEAPYPLVGREDYLGVGPLPERQ